ncbi:MAG: YraN family protein [Candidatus Kerfeldbacteria bacterium]|nr:YraN family protein [Candidatus Kerfeldbacteria bacterium]
MYQQHMTGSVGETIAADYLLGKGFTVVARNWRLRTAEIDIIAQRDDVVYFFEVKTRRSLQYGHPYEAISARKLFKIKQAGVVYVARRQLRYRALAVGVIGIVLNHTSDRCTIYYLPNVDG